MWLAGAQNTCGFHILPFFYSCKEFSTPRTFVYRSLRFVVKLYCKCCPLWSSHACFAHVHVHVHNSNVHVHVHNYKHFTCIYMYMYMCIIVTYTLYIYSVHVHVHVHNSNLHIMHAMFLGLQRRIDDIIRYEGR